MGIRLGVYGRGPGRIRARQVSIGGGKAGVKTCYGAAVWLIGARWIQIAAPLDQLVDSLRDRGTFTGDGQLGTEPIELFEIVGKQELRRATQRQLQGFRGDMRITIAIAADPTTKSQETCRASTE